VLYGVLNPAFDSIEISSAGHPLPVLVRSDSEPIWVRHDIDPPLGIAPMVRRGTFTIDIAPGTLLAFFTDGLVERPGETLDVGIEQLGASLVPDSAERSCTGAIATLVGGKARRDDVALLIVRRQNVLGHPLRVEYLAVATSLALIRSTLRRWLNWAAVPDDHRQRILLAVGEATSNVVEHAYGPVPGMVAIDITPESDGVEITVSDTGSWRAARGQHRGRGLQIMQRCADEHHVERGPAGSSVRMRFFTGVPCRS
jgi:anti-sigma regulatory factor (Ser/Thr protein kinase)